MPPLLEWTDVGILRPQATHKIAIPNDIIAKYVTYNSPKKKFWLGIKSYAIERINRLGTP